MEFVTQRSDGADLIDGSLPCVTAMEYNEQYAIFQSGITPAELLTVRPANYGIVVPEDGLYVATDRIESAEFQAVLTRFLRALRHGWLDASIAPTLAVDAVLRRAPDLNERHQAFMLETVLTKINAPSHFGLLDIDDYYSGWETLSNVQTAISRDPNPAWTHAIWNNLQSLEGTERPLTEATHYYLKQITDSAAFQVFMILGGLTFALSGILEAIRRQYDLYGKLVLGFLSGMGGGTIRDLIIGEGRLPLFYLTDLTLPACIAGLVIIMSLITWRAPDLPSHKNFTAVKLYTDIIGFASLAIGGATISISAGLHWAWAPILAALTCAGGGVLRAIVINEEPPTLKGHIYEEVAIIGAVIFLAGLAIANLFEQTALPVLIAVLVSIASIIAIRLAVQHFGIHYPSLQRKKPA